MLAQHISDLKFIFKTVMRFIPTLLLIATLAHASFFADTEVLDMNDDQLKHHLKYNSGITVLLFYASFCGHCKELAPEYARVAQTMKGVVSIVAMDGEAPENELAAFKYEIESYPVIKILNADNLEEADTYDGYLGHNDIVMGVFSAVNDLIQNRVEPGSVKTKAKENEENLARKKRRKDREQHAHTQL